MDRTTKTKQKTKINCMSSLGKHLAEEFLSLMNEEDKEIESVIAIYPGRFQPPHLGHVSAFNYIKSVPLFDDVYVVTSNKTDNIKSPLSFEDKKKIWKKHGVNKVVQVKNPYQAIEVVGKFNKETTAVVFCLGEKDMTEDPRFKTSEKSYFKKYSENEKLKPLKDNGYLYVIPSTKSSVNGKSISDLEVRETLGSNEFSVVEKKKFFKELMGWYDEEIFSDLVQKFGDVIKNESIIREFLEEYPVVKKEIINLHSTFCKTLTELSSISGVGKAMVDDGPNTSIRKQSYKNTEYKGYEVINWLLDNNEMDSFDFDNRIYKPVTTTTFFTAGVLDKVTPNNQIDLSSSKAYSEWVKYIRPIAEKVGNSIIKFTLGDMTTAVNNQPDELSIKKKNSIKG